MKVWADGWVGWMGGWMGRNASNKQKEVRTNKRQTEEVYFNRSKPWLKISDRGVSLCTLPLLDDGFCFNKQHLANCFPIIWHPYPGSQIKSPQDLATVGRKYWSTFPAASRPFGHLLLYRRSVISFDSSLQHCGIIPIKQVLPLGHLVVRQSCPSWVAAIGSFSEPHTEPSTSMERIFKHTNQLLLGLQVDSHSCLLP